MQKTSQTDVKIKFLRENSKIISIQKWWISFVPFMNLSTSYAILKHCVTFTEPEIFDFGVPPLKSTFLSRTPKQNDTAFQNLESYSLPVVSSTRKVDFFCPYRHCRDKVCHHSTLWNYVTCLLGFKQVKKGLTR